MTDAAKLFCVGLTGGVGAGKSVLAATLKSFGARIVDADDIGRTLTSPGGMGVSPVGDALGKWALASDGGLQRSEIRRRVFADSALRKKLESVLHPLIRNEIRKALSDERERGNAPYAVLSAPLLLESQSLLKLCDRVVVVRCDLQTRITRAAKRDNTDEQSIRAIASAQMSDPERIARADEVVDNNGTESDLRTRAEHLHRRLAKLARGD